MLRFEKSIDEFVKNKDLGSMSPGQLEMAVSDLLIEEARAEYDSRNFGEEIGFDIFYSKNVGNQPSAFAYALRVGEFSDKELENVFLVGSQINFMKIYYKLNILSDLSTRIIKKQVIML